MTKKHESAMSSVPLVNRPSSSLASRQKELGAAKVLGVREQSRVRPQDQHVFEQLPAVFLPDLQVFIGVQTSVLSEKVTRVYLSLLNPGMRSRTRTASCCKMAGVTHPLRVPRIK